jgi:hypothetical protein
LLPQPIWVRPNESATTTHTRNVMGGTYHGRAAPTCYSCETELVGSLPTVRVQEREDIR